MLRRQTTDEGEEIGELIFMGPLVCQDLWCVLYIKKKK